MGPLEGCMASGGYKLEPLEGCMASGGLLEAQKVSGGLEDYLPLRRGGLKEKPHGLRVFHTCGKRKMNVRKYPISKFDV